MVEKLFLLPNIIHYYLYLILAANRLAHWALMLSQYHYANTVVLSRFPNGPDVKFDEGEIGTNYDTVCTVKTLSKQIDSSDPIIITKESSNDKIISTVMRSIKDE